MLSTTQADFSRDEIQNAILHYYPDAAVTNLTALSGGMFNAVWLIHGSGALEQGVVMKIGPPPDAVLLTYETRILHTETDICRLLAPLDIPSPRVLAFDDSKSVLPCDILLLEYLPGTAWNNCPERAAEQERVHLLYQLGRYAAVLHSVQGAGFGYPQAALHASWADAFSAMMDDVLRDGHRHACALPYAQIAAVVEKHRAVLDTVRRPALVSFDLWEGNILIDETASRVTGLVDFERCFYGDPLADFLYAYNLSQNGEQRRAFLNGYTENGGQPLDSAPGAQTRIELYRLYLAVVMYVEVYRFAEDEAAGRRAWCGKDIDTVLKKLL